MGYYKVCIKDDVSYTDLNFRTIEDAYGYIATSNGPLKVAIEKNADDVLFYENELSYFHSSARDDSGREWVIDYEPFPYPGKGEGYVDMISKLRSLGAIK